MIDAEQRLLTPAEWESLSIESRHRMNLYQLTFEGLFERLKEVDARLRCANHVISQFVFPGSPMTPEQRAAWTAWKDGGG